jgi:short subunit fatty acids transporter
MAGARRSLSKIFLRPAVLAIVVGIGLLSALLGDGFWDALSWMTLALPLLVTGYYVATARQAK